MQIKPMVDSLSNQASTASITSTTSTPTSFQWGGQKKKVNGETKKNPAQIWILRDNQHQNLAYPPPRYPDSFLAQINTSCRVGPNKQPGGKTWLKPNGSFVYCLYFFLASDFVCLVKLF